MKEKIKYLDGLRGIAAFAVVLYHFLCFFYPSFASGNANTAHTSGSLEILLGKSPLNFFLNGNLAVCIFFVLSGYVLTFKFFATGDYAAITSSAAKRYTRLMIPVLATMIITCTLMKLGLFVNTNVAELTQSEGFKTYFNFRPSYTGMVKQALYHVFFNNQYTYYVSLWTMTYELLGSFLVYGLAAAFAKLQKRYIIYMVAAVLLFRTYYLAFILGMILSDLFNSGYGIAAKIKKPYYTIAFGILGFALGSFPTSLTQQTAYHLFLIPKYTTVIQYHILGAFFIMLAMLSSESLKKVFSHKVFAYLGKISFSVYLTHLTVLCTVSGYLFLYFIQFMRYNYAAALTFVITVPTILVISHFYTKLIDANGIRISQFIYDRIFQGKIFQRKKPVLVERITS